MATSTFLMVGSTTAIPSPERMDQVLTWLHGLAGGKAVLVVPAEQGVARMAAYRAEMIGFMVSEKEKDLFDPKLRLVVVMTDELTDEMIQLVRHSHSTGVPVYVLPF